MEFKSFEKIPRFSRVNMQVTQKIHGTNAAIVIHKFEGDPTSLELGSAYQIVDDTWYQVKCQSRNKFIIPGDDNYGFAAFVFANVTEFIEKLGPGVHYGEWAGPGINSGEGLKEKTFVLFDFWKYPPERTLPPQTKVVPLLYDGPFDQFHLDTLLLVLKNQGSRLVPGFMRPEGVVVRVLGQRLKLVFEAEETQWKRPDKSYIPKKEKVPFQYDHLLQPIRLEKLLSRDENYLKDYPASLPKICQDYVKDLIDEGHQIVGDDDQVEATKKALGGDLFKFVKYQIALQEETI